ncbi:TPA: RNA-binding protein [Candidatus Gracilibacteria bacterium]|nr:RNA-binding protein [Candidatus Gracilibacteria bacterium]
METKLFVGSLPWGVSDEMLREAFEQAGVVISARVITDRETGRSRGFGFVEMETTEGAAAAIEMWNEQEFDAQDGRTPRAIIVNEARPRD